MIYGLLIALQIIVSVLLVVSILLQNAKGGGLAGMAGGMASSTVFGGRGCELFAEGDHDSRDGVSAQLSGDGALVGFDDRADLRDTASGANRSGWKSGAVNSGWFASKPGAAFAAAADDHDDFNAAEHDSRNRRTTDRRQLAE